MRDDFIELIKANPDWDEETLFEEGEVEFDEEEQARALIGQHKPARQVVRKQPVPSRNTHRNPGNDLDVSGFLTAPYRFVSLNEKVVGPEKGVRDAWESGHLHDVPLAGGLCGDIDIDIAFDGPMLIGETRGENDAPLKMGSKYVIPGATLRGLLRSTMETAAYARLSQTNLHRRYGIRDFEHDLFKDENRKKVKAGWLRPWQEGDATLSDGTAPDYVIAPCQYYLVKIRDFNPGRESNPDASGMYHLSWLKMSLAGRYASMSMKQDKFFDFSRTKRFMLHNLPGPLPGVVPDEKGDIEGVYVFSHTSPSLRDVTQVTLDEQEADPAPGNQKKTECVFEAACEAAIPIARTVWNNFIANNSRPSRRAPKPIGNWETLRPTLIREGEVKDTDPPQQLPVFWVEDQEKGVGDFGLVRVFKRAHDYSVAEVLNRTGNGAHHLDLDNFEPDFVETLFGFVHEPEESGSHKEAKTHANRHLKGRVAFGFASLDDATPRRESTLVKSAMTAPKPSFGPFYLKSLQKKDWSDDRAELAGRKRYPARNASNGAVREWLEKHKGNGNEDTLSRMIFLEPTGDAKLTFKTRFRVHNVTPVELGALLWCLTFGGDDSKRHMIGRAKTAGAGEAKIVTTGTKLMMNDGTSAPDIAELLQRFCDYMAQEVPDWSRSAPIADLLNTASPERGEKLKLDYLELKGHAGLRKKIYKNPGFNKQNPRVLMP